MMGLGYRTRDRGNRLIFDRREGTVEVSIGSSTGQRFNKEDTRKAVEREEKQSRRRNVSG